MAGQLPATRNQDRSPVRGFSNAKSLGKWFEQDEIMERVEKIASKDLSPLRFVRMVGLAATKVPNLIKCDKLSLLGSVLTASARGWEIGVDAHLVPFKNKGQYECTLIPDYRGLRKSVLRAGKVERMKAGVVFEGEDYILEEGGIEEKFRYTPRLDLKGNEKVLFAWARAWMKDGTSQFVIVRKFELDRSKAASRGSDSSFSPWQKFYDRMCAKTALRRLCNELGMADEEIHKAMNADDASFRFGDGDDASHRTFDPDIEAEITVIENETGEAFDREADLEWDGDDAEDKPDSKETKKASTKKKKSSSSKPSTPKEDKSEWVTKVIERGNGHQVSTSALVAAAEALEGSKLENGLADAKIETLKDMHGRMMDADGAMKLEELALSHASGS